ncbi:hypothetical protein CTM55_02780 [Prevotella intermedia]|nr:hypothetical protein CTM55_02780 [Prevotella intermedia]
MAGKSFPRLFGKTKWRKPLVYAMGNQEKQLRNLYVCEGVERGRKAYSAYVLIRKEGISKVRFDIPSCLKKLFVIS